MVHPVKHILKKKNTFFNILWSYGEIMKYGLQPLAGLRLGLRIFADKSAVLNPDWFFGAQLH